MGVEKFTEAVKFFNIESFLLHKIFSLFILIYFIVLYSSIKYLYCFFLYFTVSLWNYIEDYIDYTT